MFNLLLFEFRFLSLPSNTFILNWCSFSLVPLSPRVALPTQIFPALKGSSIRLLTARSKLFSMAVHSLHVITVVDFQPYQTTYPTFVKQLSFQQLPISSQQSCPELLSLLQKRSLLHWQSWQNLLTNGRVSKSPQFLDTVSKNGRQAFLFFLNSKISARSSKLPNDVLVLRPCGFFLCFLSLFFHQTYAGTRKKCPKKKIALASAQCPRPPDQQMTPQSNSLCWVQSFFCFSFNKQMIEINSFQSPRKFAFSWYLTSLRGQRTFWNLFNRNIHQYCECIRLAEIAR